MAIKSWEGATTYCSLKLDKEKTEEAETGQHLSSLQRDLLYCHISSHWRGRHVLQQNQSKGRLYYNIINDEV